MNKRPVSYMQTDPRWADMDYSAPGEKTTIGRSGCGPTCAAMLIETLTGGVYTPLHACNWALEHGYKAPDQGTYYSYFEPQFEAFGLCCRRLNWTSIYGDAYADAHDAAWDLLKQGWYLIACMGKGTWTSSGHYIVVWWQNGKVHINDPASTKQERVLGDRKTFEKEVKYYWAIDAHAFNKEDSEMSYEEFKQHMERYRKELGELPASEDWGEKGVKDAQEAGISDGTRPRDLVTREEVMCMVTRAM